MSRTIVSPHVLARITGILVGVSLLLTAASARAESYPQTRTGWFIGLAAGVGNAGFAADTERETGAAGSFRFGHALNEQWGLGIESNAWTKNVDDVTFTFNVAGPAVYFYPGSGGLVLRGGVGMGGVRASADAGSVTVSQTESGLGFTAGAAYDFRINRTFSIGPQIDLGWMSIDSGGSNEEINYVNLGLSFDGHFIPKQ